MKQDHLCDLKINQSVDLKESIYDLVRPIIPRNSL